MWTLYEGDCLEVMPTLPDNSVDLILCDLPYGTTSCAWDSVIPLEELWTQYKRLLRRGGVIALTACQPFTTALISSNLEWFKYCWIWEKPQGVDPFMAKIRPLNNYEEVIIFAPGKHTYNPIKLRGKPYKVTRDRKPRKLQTTDTELRTSTTVNDGDRYPTRVLHFNQERGYHPTQKPVALFGYLIETYTNPGDMVLDNCAGSGTTGVAAEQTGRNSILIEREPQYCAIIRERMSKVQQPLMATV